MTIVYMVSEDAGCYDESSPLGLFSTREKAETFINGFSGYDVEEWELDEELNKTVKTVWACIMTIVTGPVFSEWHYHNPCKEGYEKATNDEASVYAYSAVSQAHCIEVAETKRQEALRKEAADANAL